MFEAMSSNVRVTPTFLNKMALIQGSVDFKVILVENGVSINEAARAIEVRRVAIEKDVVTSFLYLSEKIRSLFNFKGQPFSIYWKDVENDYVTVSSDEDLVVCLTENSVIYKLYVQITCQNDDILHPNVQCDSCESPVSGKRFKCVECPDYDLCSSCELAGKHNHHMMIRITQPDVILNIPLRRLLSKLKCKRGAMGENCGLDNKRGRCDWGRGATVDDGDEENDIEEEKERGDRHHRRHHHHKHNKGSKRGRGDCCTDEEAADLLFDPIRLSSKHGRRVIGQFVPHVKSVLDCVLNAIDPFVVAAANTSHNETNNNSSTSNDNHSQPETHESKKEEKPEDKSASNINNTKNNNSNNNNNNNNNNSNAQQSQETNSTPNLHQFLNNIGLQNPNIMAQLSQIVQQMRLQDIGDPDWTIINRPEQPNCEPQPSTSASAPMEQMEATTVHDEINRANQARPIDIDDKAPSAPLEKTSHNVLVQSALEKMVAMGFSNEGGLLTHLLEIHNGDIYKALEALQIFKK